ncbi:RNA 2',3'-cyclic phosphodiesterase [Lysinibacillus antri]|uniref:RNA 2',3'-cyclic phosphodiesterase n=1 Tax=Lysinibacillus antri TaxID=2498145 RepID=A0A3S0QPM4_9BACI|nr:RNA 2',3'-cyclic phosphodiesterase [Lysinibacillus antri]RUL52042.1 RNA 2',3'-cyclic phosphodiesterase [Lysinibacillus antri]
MAIKHHYFFAVKLPNEVKSFLNEWVQKNKKTFPFKRWVHEQDYHITLAFLGNVEKELLSQTVKSAKVLLKGQRFSLTLNKIGTFGAVKSPRIFWADVEHSAELNNIQSFVYNHCLDLGFELDKKPFRPHITLARKWDSEQPFHQDSLTFITTEDGEKLTFTVNEIILYESHIEETPKYKEFASFPLH